MTKTSLLGAGIGIALLVFTLSVANARVRQASSTVDAAAADLSRLVEDAARLLELRTRPQAIASERVPETTILESLNHCLREASISPSQLGAVTPAGTDDEGVDGQREAGSEAERLVYRTQAMRVGVLRLTPLEIGRFLARWSAQEPLWRLSRISIDHSREAGTAVRPRGGQENLDLNRYDLTIEMTTTYATYSAASR